MSTVEIVIVVALSVVLLLVVGGVLLYATRRGGGGSLRRRFGPEYDRTVARHDGDTKAAEQELKERVRRHGDLRPKPLPAKARETYVTQWAGVQERFVDAPRQATADAERLIARLAAERGYPDGDRREEQLDALSVHHGARVHGYRLLHARVAADAGTEELRGALLEARSLFDELLPTQGAAQGTERGGRAERPRARVTESKAPTAEPAKEPADESTAQPAKEPTTKSTNEPMAKSTTDPRPKPSRKFRERAHQPWAFRTKGEAR
ncbi:hypothetical protein [Streptomyces sp. NBC_01304]|uniref:hypothetical protein n=1 Tax=Streptomyces sp. NBC_01304 TaxID=2903818 RepID=UPI002E133B95|nr:hypothetical protein OG430_33875 [Streptomyces sp. NBC_01304]